MPEENTQRLQTVMERVLDEISFSATEYGGGTITVDTKYVRDRVEDFSKDQDLSRFIL